MASQQGAGEAERSGPDAPREALTFGLEPRMRRIHRLRSAASLALAFLAAGALAGCAAVGSPGRVPGTVESRPNILFIYTDDQASWAVHAARDGHPDLRTPNLDRLIREGAYLPNSFVVTPVCSPSRAQLKTSRYGSELGITDWINARRQPGIGLPGEVPTWPQALSEAGYTVGLLGKWHLGTLPHFHPRHHGFGYSWDFSAAAPRSQIPWWRRVAKSGAWRASSRRS
jgi:hypothetical protein